MNMKSTSAEEYKLVTSFEAIRDRLLSGEYEDRLEKPLAYWTLPTDRRLPLAFLGRTVRELLESPYHELAGTAGIGQKKIASLVKLLNRVAETKPDNGEIREDPETIKKLTQVEQDDGQFDYTRVSESLWVGWRETVRRLDLGDTKLGRVTPSLQNLPTVIWHTPLHDYLDRSLADIRELRTHGEKRIRVVLEAFYIVNQMLASARPNPSVSMRLVPQFVIPVERWLQETFSRPLAPTVDEMRENLAVPLVHQIRVDAGPTVHQLAQGRLGINEEPVSVRMQSRRMGVTRARVYQMLEECSKVMEVRWPEGRLLLGELARRQLRYGASEKERAFFETFRELFYPVKYENLESAIFQ